MRLAIPRGIVYHCLIDDFRWAIACIFSRLSEPGVVEEFEQRFADYCDRRHCIAFPYARTAIYFALKLKDFPRGSEVIMPPITIKAILDVVLDLGLKPVFVDIDRDTLTFDCGKLEDSITRETRAILLTYLFGIVPDLGAIVELSRRHKLFLIEDFSQCLNGRFLGKKVGSFGEVGVYSASSIKTLDTYGGGLLVCDDDILMEKLKSAAQDLTRPSRLNLLRKIMIDITRNLATSRVVFNFIVFPLIRLLNWLNPGSVMKHTGERSQEMVDSLPANWFESYSSLQAKVGLAAIESVTDDDAKRVRNVKYIKNHAIGIDFPRGVEGADNVYWQLVAYFDEPLLTQRQLNAHKVDSSTTSLVKISSLEAYPYSGLTPNADYLYSNGMFIPCFAGLSSREIDRVCTALNSLDSQERKGQ